MIADFGPGRKKQADPDYALRLIADDFMAYKKNATMWHFFLDLTRPGCY